MTLVIRDLDNNTYIQENYLGKGAFSKSYILKKDGRTFCGKFIPKRRSQMGKQLDSIAEFSILSKLQHKNIVNFVKCIETSYNFCLITEYYPHKSMFELIQRRSKLTVYEVRYFSRQLLDALKYLHESSVIHRDMKPQNMLLDKNMNLKLADFGMAVICSMTGFISKRHIYGTPNYISPEMITRSVTRYNYKVDIWAVGCFLFHMYIGKTPFRGKDERFLYSNIKKCQYNLPSDMVENLASLIRSILNRDPECRPDASQILDDDFYKNGFTPTSLPITALVDKPKFIVPAKEKKFGELKAAHVTTYCKNKCLRRSLIEYENYLAYVINRSALKFQDMESLYYEIEYPMLNPLVWVKQITKQIKNIGYTLNDGTRGVLFEDKTVLVLLPNGINLYYVTSEKQIKFYTIFKLSGSVMTKLTTLKFMFNIMKIPKSVSTISSISENNDWLPMLPYLQSYYETTKYYVLLMSNGLYEVIAKVGDMMLLLCIKTSGFSVTNNENRLKTYDLHSLSKYQYPEGLHKHLKIMHSSLHRVLMKNPCFACKKKIENNAGDDATNLHQNKRII